MGCGRGAAVEYCCSPGAAAELLPGERIFAGPCDVRLDEGQRAGRPCTYGLRVCERERERKPALQWSVNTFAHFEQM